MDRSTVIAGVITLAAVAWVASGQVGGSRASPSPKVEATPAASQTQDKPLPQVRVVRLTARPMIDEVVLQGRTGADRIVELRAEISGRIDEVLAERGQRVKTGEPILRIAVEDRETALQRARALLEQRRIEFEAARALASKGFNSEIKLAEAKAQFEAAQTSVRRAEVDLANTVVRAPFDGVLDKRPVEVGDFLNVGTSVATVVDLDPIKVVGFVSERNIADLRVGAPGHARLLGEREAEGSIGYISASADPATRTFRVELSVPNPDHRIVDGLTAQLRLPLSQRMAHKVSPAVLSLADDGTIGVKLVEDGNKVRFAPVRLLGSAPDGVWLGGLPDAITLIAVGQDYVVAGQEVKPVEMEGDRA